jgi:hypothetical protein
MITGIQKVATLFAVLIFSSPIAAIEVPLVKEGGVYTVPVRINDVLTLDFIIDSGAAEVQVPADVALTLLRTGTISQSDFLPGETYRLADGSTTKSSRFNIKELKVGDYSVKQVAAGISDVQGPLLLGQSFLSKVPAWSQDNTRGVLVIGKDGVSSIFHQPEAYFSKSARIESSFSRIKEIITNGGGEKVNCAYRGQQASNKCQITVKKELVTNPDFVSWYGKPSTVDVLNIIWPDGDRSKYTWSDSGEMINLNGDQAWGYRLSGNEVEQDWSRGFVIEKDGDEYIRLW